MIPTRLEKLKFLAEEMQIAFHLSMHAEDSFAARTLARHILVRAKDFIEHARQLRKPLRDAGYDIGSFHSAKEGYASAFDEYLKVARHRLGAHVQDLDFGERIELWNDIEIVKISFFVDGSKEIYGGLASLSLPNYVPYSEPAELKDPALIDALRQFQRELESRNWIEIGTDPLALTRNNTSAVLNTTPVHVRASQLTLIRRWLAMQAELHRRLAPYPRVARILKARIITDLVSFCDCLVSRPLASGAPQAMDGLDKLIRANGQSAKPIDDFVAASQFEAELQSARTIRDTVGAHLETDDARPLASLLADLDSCDLAAGLDFHERVYAAFAKTCFGIIFLRGYAADGQRLYGISASRNRSVPYSGDADTAPLPAPEPPPINDEEAYWKYLTRWLDGNEDQRGDARQFFWHALLGSEVLETINETADSGTGLTYARGEFRKAHQFLLSALSDGLSDSDFEGIVQLILLCRGGAPYPLAEILVRHGRQASVFRQWRICRALGDIASEPHASAREFLEARSQSSSWPIRLEAALARFKRLVAAEGVFRLNHEGKTGADYDALVQSLTSAMTDAERLIALLAFAAMLSPHSFPFSQPFQKNYEVLQTQIENICLPFFEKDDKESKVGTLNQLIQTHDYVGVSVLLALELENCDRLQPLRTALIESCCHGAIAAARHDQSVRHLAMCFLVKKDHRRAFEIAQGLAARNPDWVEVQVLAAQILGETPGAEEEAAQRISTLRRAYKLTPAHESTLAAVEAEIAKGQQVS